MGYVLVANAEGVSLEQPGLDVEKEDARLVVLGIVQGTRTCVGLVAVMSLVICVKLPRSPAEQLLCASMQFCCHAAFTVGLQASQ
jgi:hypothetical protein